MLAVAGLGIGLGVALGVTLGGVVPDGSVGRGGRLLVVGGRRRGGGTGFVVGAEDAAEKAGGVFGLCLLLLGGGDPGLQVGELLLSLIEGVLLDEDGLREDVEGVGGCGRGRTAASVRRRCPFRGAGFAARGR